MRSVIFFRISPRLKKKFKTTLLLVLLLCGAWLGGRELSFLGGHWLQSGGGEISPYLLMDKAYRLLAVEKANCLGILLETMPVLATTADTQAMAGQKVQKSGLVESALSAVVDIDLQDPKSFLGSQLTIFKMVAAGNDLPSLTTLEGEVEEEEIMEEYIPELEEPTENPLPEPKLIKSDKPVVAIYNTHNAETYVPTDGKEKLEGKNGGIAKVAGRLAEALEAKGVKTVRSTTIHDYPSFPKSYGNSEKTVRAMLAGNPSIQIVIDVHRDAGLKSKETVKINGKDTAKIMLIVGSNARLEHSDWEKNKAFAEKVVKKMEQIYPGLSKGYRVQSGRYNQHLHPNAILIEVGSAKNSQEEAERAVTLFADVIIHVLADMQKEKL
ncbi:stage II sporulation protein P [Zhaonella formicivorans]|uniref:stage II sporulation protein P n=1 Tax=Zhaonella formicivorans TaxID=2528593 RepID=UPI0010EED12A|nr:stage II sporulation protein P [Zhaonella formicivorans]